MLLLPRAPPPPPPPFSHKKRFLCNWNHMDMCLVLPKRRFRLDFRTRSRFKIKSPKKEFHETEAGKKEAHQSPHQFLHWCPQ